jgi:hypothetical protein
MKPKLIRTQSRISLSLTAVEKQMKTIPQKAFNFFYFETPIDTGNARSKTRLKGDTIRADYAYAGRLDRGYSKQARDGMSRPTLRYIRQLVRNIFGR